MRTVYPPHCRSVPEAVAKIAVLIALTLGVGGCNLLKNTLELPEKGIRSLFSLDQENDAADPVELQSQLLRFADNSIESLNIAIGKLRMKDDEATRKRTLLRRRITTTKDILAVVTGANINANLLDMVILASLNRMNVEDFWIPNYYGESARPYLQASKEVEKQILRIAETALKKEQLSELRAAIKTWHEQHPNVRSPSDIGALGFAAEIAQSNRSSSTAITTSVFNLLAIDPLAGLDPATRELADTRLFAERGLFLARHMPTLIRWETELLIVQAAEVPQLEKLLADVSQFSDSADRFSRTTEDLPGLIREERRQIVQALDKHRPGLTSLAAQTEKAMDAGKQMSDASTATLETFQEVVRQLQAFPSEPNAEPFRIVDYTAAAVQIGDSAQNLENLLQAFNRTFSPANIDNLSSRLEAAIRQIQTGGKELVDYTFRQTLLLGLLLIGSACAMGLASAIAFWKLKKKFAQNH
jgi:hypothetical protein